MKIWFRITLFSFIVFLSCSKEKQKFDDTQIQFNLEKIEHVIPFSNQGVEDTLSVQISVIGKPFENTLSIPIEYLIDDSTANLLQEKPSSVQMGSGETESSLKIVFDLSKIQEQTKGEFSLSIKNDEVATNYSNVTVNYYRQALIDVLKGYYSCYESEYNYSYEVELFHTDPLSDTIMISNFWDFSKDGQFVKLVINGDKIDMIQQEFVDIEENVYDVQGSGTIDNNGYFTIEYEFFKNGEIYERGIQEYVKFIK